MTFWRKPFCANSRRLADGVKETAKKDRIKPLFPLFLPLSQRFMYMKLQLESQLGYRGTGHQGGDDTPRCRRAAEP